MSYEGWISLTVQSVTGLEICLKLILKLKLKPSLLASLILQIRIFFAMFHIWGEGCFTDRIDDPTLDDFQVGEFDRFSGKKNFAYHFNITGLYLLQIKQHIKNYCKKISYSCKNVLLSHCFVQQGYYR